VFLEGATIDPEVDSGPVVAGQVPTTLSFRTAGVQRLSITSTGNVGIGTTTPTEKLDVSGNAHVSGNVGIGTQTPAVSTKLEVAGKVKALNLSYASTTNDLSDFNHLSDFVQSSSASWRTLVDVTGPGTLVGGTVLGYYFRSASSGMDWDVSYRIVISIDGGTPFSYPKTPKEIGYAQDHVGNNSGVVVLPPIHFNSSLKITYYYPGTNLAVNGYAMVRPDDS